MASAVTVVVPSAVTRVARGEIVAGQPLGAGRDAVAAAQSQAGDGDGGAGAAGDVRPWSAETVVDVDQPGARADGGVVRAGADGVERETSMTRRPLPLDQPAYEWPPLRIETGVEVRLAKSRHVADVRPRAVT